MGFGLRDRDWTDPPEDAVKVCSRVCEHFDACPCENVCGCCYGKCTLTGEWVEEGEECA